MSSRHCIIIPYFFGDRNKRPNGLTDHSCYDMFMKTLAKQDFDVLLFTNRPVLYSPPNLKVIRCEKEDIYQSAESALGEKIKIQHYYKLCDLRVIYPLIFKGYIQGYDYIGHGDVDVAYGHFDDVIEATEDLKFGCHEHLNALGGKHYGHGCFCMYRNDERATKILEQIPNGLEILTEQKNIAIDERLMPDALLNLFGKNYQVRIRDYNQAKGKRFEGGRIYGDDQELHLMHFFKLKNERETIRLL